MTCVARASCPLDRERPAPVGARAGPRWIGAGRPRPSGRDARATNRTRHCILPRLVDTNRKAHAASGFCRSMSGAHGGSEAAHFPTSSIDKPSRSLEPKLNREDNRLAVYFVPFLDHLSSPRPAPRRRPKNSCLNGIPPINEWGARRQRGRTLPHNVYRRAGRKL